MRNPTLFLILILSLAACQPTAAATPTNPPPTVEAPAVVLVSTETPRPEPPAIPTEIPPSPTPTALPRLFTFVSDKPVVPSGPSEAWDGKYVNPGAIIFHNGMFHMFRNGFKSWPGNISFGYMTSPDSLTWTALQDDPLFTSEDVPFAAPGADVSSVVVLDDGTWVLYFHTVNRTEKAVIGRATAPDPLGTWTVDLEPVLTGGGGGAWEDGNVSWPHVLRTNAGFVMYYQAENRTQTAMSIGMATSVDGTTWTKYNDPVTNEPAFNLSDPVLVAGSEWDGGKVGRPVPVITPDGWVMIFAGSNLDQRGIATSSDGIHWTLHPDNPVIAREDYPLSGKMWDTALVYNEGIFYYFTEIGTLARTNIYLATHEGRLP